MNERAGGTIDAWSPYHLMFRFMQVVTLALVAAALAFALAHAAEFPGKLRLDEATYRAVQRIYYPGFTVGGAAEPLAILALVVLLVLTPRTTSAFGWTAAALVAVIGMQAVYWLMTHPVNAVWLQGQELRGGAGTFFGLGAARRARIGRSCATAGSTPTSSAPCSG